MAGPLNEFTQVAKFDPETFGDPGKRTFRINAESASSTAKVWLEKEQLAELCLAITQMDRENNPTPSDTNISPSDLEAEPLTNLDFKANRLAFGHNPDSGMFVVDAYDPQLEDEDDEPTVRIWVTRDQIRHFSRDGLAIVSSGRAICDLCGKPKNLDGHYCERTNGHSKEGAENL